MKTKGLVIWTVYDRPTDFPHNFVARKYIGETATSEVLISDDLHSLQQLLWEKKLIRLPRMDEDVPSIVEIWL